MAKYVLNSNTDDLDFALIGLRCAENQYFIVDAVNRALGTELRLRDNIPYNLKDGKLFYFSLFGYTSEEFGLDYYLIPNASNFDETQNTGSRNDLFGDLNVEESTKLIKELPKTDYFIILKGEDLHQVQFKITELLKTIEEVQQIQIIEPRDLPSKMNLVF